VRVLLDTSVLISAESPGEIQAAIIAATVNAHNVPLLTRNAKDSRLIADLVEAREPLVA
jgi:predicted nucleic acid-binding protein